MATWEVVGPDGKRYRVQGDSAEGAVQAVAQSIGQSDPRQAMRDRIAAAKDGTLTASPESLERAQAADQRAEDRMTIAREGYARGLTAKAVQGTPFVGEWIDEGIERFNPERGQQVRNLQAAMDRENPKAALAAEIAGGVLTSAPLAVGAVGAAVRGGRTALNVLRGMAIGGSAGAVEGASAGAGRAAPGERIAGAQRGLTIGAGLGAVLGGAGPVAADAITSLSRRIKRLDVSTIAREFGLSAPAARSVKSALMNDNLDQAAQRLSVLDGDAMLADAGQATGALLDAASKTGGRALAVTREAVEDRSAQAGQRLSGVLDNILGNPSGVREGSRQIAQRTASRREAAYNAAWRAPINYSTGGPGEKVLGVLDRIPSEFLSPAIKRANRRAQMAGEDGFKQIMASIADDGTVTFSELPNMRQLHEIKVALSDIVSDGTDAITGRKTPDAVDAQRVAKMLRDALKDASPAYGRASKLGGDKLAEQEAFDVGRKLLRSGTTFEDVSDVMRDASVEAKEAARRGMRTYIEQTLSNVRRTITDPNIDAREAMTLVKEMSSRANMKKARMVLGTDAKAVFDELERAEAALALRSMVARNSDTAIRGAIQESVKAEGSPGLMRRVSGDLGNPLEAMREITKEAAGMDARTVSAQQKAIYDEIAERLVQIRGEDAQRALAAVRRAMSGQPIKDAEAELIGRVLSGSATAGGYQGIMQPQQ